MNNATRLRRLNHFIKVLKKIPTAKFSMGIWMKLKYFNKPINVEVPSDFIPVDCQTAGCALGWAACDKKFVKAGLVWNKSSSHTLGEIKFGIYTDGQAGAKFFGINQGEADDIFAPSNYRELDSKIKPSHVITKVKKLIKKYK